MDANMNPVNPLEASLGAKLHIPKCIFLLLSMLGVLLQLKQQGAAGNGSIGSPFVTDYVTALIFIVALFLYIGLLGTLKILQASSNNSDLGAFELIIFIHNMSLLCETLASILLLLMLVPAFGWLALLFWTICFVSIAAKSYHYLKTLYATAVAALVHAFHKLKQLIAQDQIHGLP